jgi:lysyl-tRNA synthetase class 2
VLASLALRPMTSPPPSTQPDDLPEQMRVRLEKLQRMRERGVDPYAPGYPRTATVAELRKRFEGLGEDVSTGERVAVAGRVVLNRVSGKIIFATVRDGTADLQVMLTLDASGQELLEQWKSDVDLGDHVGVSGEVITSKRGELSVLADEFTITSKCLRPLPEKHAGLTDPEARVRQRYVDLIVRPEARDMLYLRSTLVRSIRESLQRRGFVEVETPMLQVVHGGANARPFETHINAYDIPLYLRIAPELYLKRLLVGGVEKVFEINRNFRNEGADSKNNPEFTMLEMYEVYGDYDTMRILTQEIIQEAATAVFGAPVARRVEANGEVKEYDLSGDWPVKTMIGALSEALGEEVSLDSPLAKLRQLAESIGLEQTDEDDPGMLVEELYVELVERQTTTPVFYKDFPKNNAPLTRLHRDDPRLSEKWDLVSWGTEQGTGYSELIDPIDQRERFVQQSIRAAGGDEEAMRLDEDFLRALEFGMPPSGGQGMGIDRLIMNLTGLGIRDTILFPLVKPE